MSLVAVKYKMVERTGTDRSTGETRAFSFKGRERYLAVGEEARRYEHTPDVMVFPPSGTDRWHSAATRSICSGN